jgi:hypothetical protein
MKPRLRRRPLPYGDDGGLSRLNRSTFHTRPHALHRQYGSADLLVVVMSGELHDGHFVGTAAVRE